MRGYRIDSLFATVVVLILLWLAVLCRINPNRFTSPDSWVYLRMATFRDVWESTFPAGYPALIRLVSVLTGLSILWASKLVNAIAILTFGLLWSRRLSQLTATLLISIFLMGQFLRIAAYTWSETVFLVLLAEWVWAYHRYELPDTRSSVRLFVIGMALFLIRYAGIFVWLMLPVLNWTRKAGDRFRSDALLVCAGLGTCAAYFGLNQYLSGSPYGGPRFMPEGSARGLMLFFGQALVNECLLIRDWIPQQGLSWPLAGGLLQAGISWLGWRAWRRAAAGDIRHPCGLARLLLLTGLGYLIFLWGVRVVSPFQGPDARTMAPMTFLFLMALICWLEQQPERQRAVRPYWLLLVIGSWAQVWPQRTPVQSQHSIISKSPSPAEMRTKPSAADSLLLPVR